MRLDGGIWYWWPADDAFSCPKKWHASLNQHMVKSEGFIARPTSWTGEGLPPVGTELEAGFACEEFETWHKGVCVAVGEDPEGREEFCVVKFGTKLAMYTDEGRRMRPIRTPEQVAADERTRAIDELVKVTCINRGEAGRIYDAGYRKQAPQ